MFPIATSSTIPPISRSYLYRLHLLKLRNDDTQPVSSSIIEKDTANDRTDFRRNLIKLFAQSTRTRLYQTRRFLTSLHPQSYLFSPLNANSLICFNFLSLIPSVLLLLSQSSLFAQALRISRTVIKSISSTGRQVSSFLIRPCRTLLIHFHLICHPRPSAS